MGVEKFIIKVIATSEFKFVACRLLIDLCNDRDYLTWSFGLLSQDPTSFFPDPALLIPDPKYFVSDQILPLARPYHSLKKRESFPSPTVHSKFSQVWDLESCMYFEWVTCNATTSKSLIRQYIAICNWESEQASFKTAAYIWWLGDFFRGNSTGNKKHVDP